MSTWERDPTTGNLSLISGMPTRNDIINVAESSDVDTADNTVSYTSDDTTDANADAWTSVTKLDGGEDHKTLFQRISQMFKNIRYLYKTKISVPTSATLLATISSTAANTQVNFSSNLTNFTFVQIRVNQGYTTVVYFAPCSGTIGNTVSVCHGRPHDGYGALGMITISNTYAKLVEVFRAYGWTFGSIQIYGYK